MRIKNISISTLGFLFLLVMAIDSRHLFAFELHQCRAKEDFFIANLFNDMSNKANEIDKFNRLNIYLPELVYSNEWIAEKYNQKIELLNLNLDYLNASDINDTFKNHILSLLNPPTHTLSVDYYLNKAEDHLRMLDWSIENKVFFDFYFNLIAPKMNEMNISSLDYYCKGFDDKFNLLDKKTQYKVINHFNTLFNGKSHGGTNVFLNNTQNEKLKQFTDDFNEKNQNYLEEEGLIDTNSGFNHFIWLLFFPFLIAAYIFRNKKPPQINKK